MKDIKEIYGEYEINVIYISGEIYKPPEEKVIEYNYNHIIVRNIQIKFNDSSWIMLTFNDPELWEKVRKMKIGQYIKVEGIVANRFSVNSGKANTSIIVSDVLEIKPGKNKFIKREQILKLKNKEEERKFKSKSN